MARKNHAKQPINDCLGCDDCAGFAIVLEEWVGRLDGDLVDKTGVNKNSILGFLCTVSSEKVVSESFVLLEVKNKRSIYIKASNQTFNIL